jgi:cobalamin synthase
MKGLRLTIGASSDGISGDTAAAAIEVTELAVVVIFSLR